MKTTRYNVAGHCFAVVAPEGMMREGYKPFEILADCKSAAQESGIANPLQQEIANPLQQEVFRLTVTDRLADDTAFELEVSQEDEGQTIEAGHIGQQPAFRFGFGGRQTGLLRCAEDYTEATLFLNDPKWQAMATTDNAVMILYALTTADKATLLMHASTVVCQGRGYLFIAPSGTGKSTHSQLWLQHIEGSWLLNDDNPVMRLTDCGAVVYGSPWSGKTPCYKNLSAPISGIVQLAQALRNEIRRLTGLEAYAALMASASGKRWDRRLADGLHQTLNRAAQTLRVYHLDCLPDEEAAQLCALRVKNEE